MKNNTKIKGFTLIELLVVIAILALLLLIAVPTMLNAINKSKDSSIKSGADLYIKAINDQLGVGKLDKNSKINDGVYGISDLSEKGVTMNGTLPTNGRIKIENQTVIEAQICMNGKSVEYKNNITNISSNDYCTDNAFNFKITLNNGTTNYTENISTIDTVTFDNINTMSGNVLYCTNGATPTYSNGKVIVKNISSNTSCATATTISIALGKSSDVGLLLLNDITENVKVASGKSATIDLNQHTLTSTTAGITLQISGNATISNGKVYANNIEACINAITVFGTANINNVEIEDNGTCAALVIGRSSVRTGIATVNGGSIVANSHGAISYSESADKVLELNNTTITSNADGIYNLGPKTITVNDCNVSAKYAIVNNVSGTININGGIYTSTVVTSTVHNISTGIINIDGSKKRVYIANHSNILPEGSSTWANKTIYNRSTGSINIKGEQADICTDTDGSNGKGVCIYGYYRTVLNESSALGTINIDGATVISEKMYAISNYCGTININNVNAKSLSYTLTNNNSTISEVFYSPTTNICNSVFESINAATLYNKTGYVNYNGMVTLKSKTATNIVDSNSPSHTVLDNGLKCN